MNAKTFADSFSLVARIVAVVATAAAAMVLYAPVAQACDACNNAFKNEILGERSDSLTGQEIIQAMDNHADIPVLNSSSDAEAPTALAQADTAPADAAPTVLAQAGDDPMIPTSVRGVAAPDDVGELFDDDEPFIDVIERDQNLENTPPTSYVPQDTEPDVSFTVELNEGKTYIGQGVVYDGLLIDGGTPGQDIVVTEGDVVEMKIENTGTVPHGASIHAAYTQTSKYVGDIGPNQSKSIVFRVNTPGIYMYHCAPGGHAIPMHVIGGQYGMLVVEPAEEKFKLEEELGHGPDITINLLQNEFYASGKDAVEGNPLYTSFNGRVFRYVEEPIVVHPGDYVRINYLNVGPQNVSTFHLVGIIWDYVYWQGNPANRMQGGQTVTSGPSDSWTIEFRAPPDEGAYLMLDHAVGNTSRGAIGILAVDSEAERSADVNSQGPVYSEAEIEEKIEGANRTINPYGIGDAPADQPVSYGPEVDEVHVEIIANSYYPKVIEVEPGTKVTWSNEDVFTYMDGEFSGIHNAVGTSGPESFATDMLAHAETDSFVFTEPGEYEYMCTPHPYMQGKVIVRDAADGEEEAEASGCSTTSGTPVIPVAAMLVMLAGLALVRRSGTDVVVSNVE